MAITIDCTFSCNLANTTNKGKLVSKYSAFRNLIDKNGALVDFDTDAISMDKDHPVDIQIQEVYDGSVNLILNDDVHVPRLVNSRFSTYEDKQYIIPDHIGNKDTNLYQEEDLELDISLQKTISQIPRLEFEGLQENGVLKCGTYNFYFKLADNDDNTTDFIAESSIVMVHIGKINDPFSMRMGMENEKTNKSVNFKLYNLDTSYDYVKVWYTRSTSGADGSDVLSAYEIIDKFPILGIGQTSISIYGIENTIECALSDINPRYEYIGSAKSAAVVQNRLFLGNISKPEIPYEKLMQYSLHFYPYPTTKYNSIGNMDIEYKDNSISSTKGGYYNAKNVYYSVGYWPEEYYRFGIVYIYSDFSLSPVFDVQGIDWVNGRLNDKTKLDYLSTVGQNVFSLQNGDNFQEVQYNEEGYITNSQTTTTSRNIYGVTRMPDADLLKDGSRPMGVEFKFLPADPKLTEEIKKVIRGYFFVRQKRKPLTLAQGVVIGKTKDGYSNLPCLQNSKSRYQIESFLTAKPIQMDTKWGNSYQEVNKILKRSMINIKNNHVTNQAMIVPDACVREPMFNQIFTSAEFYLDKYYSTTPRADNEDISYTANPNEWAPKDTSENSRDYCQLAKCTMVNEGIPITTDGENYFSSRAGEESNVLSFQSVNCDWDHEGRDVNYANINAFSGKNIENFIWQKAMDDTVIRGLFGTYVGISKSLPYGDIVNIRDTQYNPNKIISSNALYYKVRKNDLSPYFAISDRYELKQAEKGTICYRGDCFICNFTHRMQRNFVDPELPTNDRIIQPSCWNQNLLVITKMKSESENFYVNEIVPEFKAKMVYKLITFSKLKKMVKDENDDSLLKPLTKAERESVWEMIQDQLNPVSGERNSNKKIEDSSSDTEEDEINNDAYDQVYQNILNKEQNPLYGTSKAPFKRWMSVHRLVPAKSTSGGVEGLLTVLKLLDPGFIGGMNIIASLIQAQLALVDEEAICFSAPNIKIITPEDSKYDTMGSGLEKMGIPNTWYSYGLHKINRSDVNSVGIGHWLTTRILSNYNLCLRDIDMYNTEEYSIFNAPRSFYPLQKMSLKSQFKIQESGKINGGINNTTSYRFNIHLPEKAFIRQQYDTRIAYSDPCFSTQTFNGFRIFTSKCFKDYTQSLGAVTQMIPIERYILVILEHGIAMLPIQERVLSGSGSGGNVYTNTGEILPEFNVLSDMYGSTWPESIIKTPRGVYGVDTIAKKIWYTTGQSVECISDFKVQSFLNKNINLQEWDLFPISGVRNVKSHYNAFKGDVMFTFYNGETEWNLCWNEQLKVFQTFYDWIPSHSANIDNIFFTLDLQDTKNILRKNPEIPNKTYDTKDYTVSAYFNLNGDLYLNDYYAEDANLEVLSASYTFTFNNPQEELTQEDFEDKYHFIFSQLVDSTDFDDNKYYTVTKEFGFNTTQDDNDKEVVDYNTINYKITISINPIYIDYFKDNSIKNIRCSVAIPQLMVENSENLGRQLILNGYVIQYFNIIDRDQLKCNIWKHGQSGIYDGQFEIKPTMWYNKQYPFEFEFVVTKDSMIQKIYNNLMLMSNKAQPEEVSVEVVGESYEWYTYKELIKYMNKQSHTIDDLYKQYTYILSTPIHKWNDVATQYSFWLGHGCNANAKPLFTYPTVRYKEKSENTIQKLPFLRYIKRTVDGKYHFEQSGLDMRFTHNVSDTDIIEDELRNEERMRSTQMCNDIREVGRIAGNCEYKEDEWFIELRPMNIRYAYLDANGKLQLSKMYSPRLRDKYARIRVKYSGEDLALIQAIQTVFDYSYC